MTDYRVEQIARGHHDDPDYLRARAEAYERDAETLALAGEDDQARRYRGVAKGLLEMVEGDE